jgi:protein ImuA
LPLEEAATAHDVEQLHPSLHVESLHSSLWRADQLGQQRGATWPSGFAALDAELPGGGWPSGALTELLLAHPGVGEMRLLASVLVRVQAQQRCVMLVDPPAALHTWAWQALGIDLQRLVLVRSRERPLDRARPRALHGGAAREPVFAADALWALEHALKSGHVGAVLAWLPLRLRGDALRRLQLAAQSHEGPVFLLRDSQARALPSVAPLRLWLTPAGPDELSLRLLKRRGPPLMQPLRLALVPVLSAPARARALRVVRGPQPSQLPQAAPTAASVMPALAPIA